MGTLFNSRSLFCIFVISVYKDAIPQNSHTTQTALTPSPSPNLGRGEQIKAKRRTLKLPSPKVGRGAGGEGRPHVRVLRYCQKFLKNKFVLPIIAFLHGYFLKWVASPTNPATHQLLIALRLNRKQMSVCTVLGHQFVMATQFTDAAVFYYGYAIC